MSEVWGGRWIGRCRMVGNERGGGFVSRFVEGIDSDSKEGT